MPSQEQIDALAKRLARGHRTHGNIEDRVTGALPLHEKTPEGTMVNLEHLLDHAQPYWQTWRRTAFLALRHMEPDDAG